MQPARPVRASERGNVRRALLASHALAIVGENGLHALTHRAVDAAAGLPVGSCSFHYGTRRALVSAAAEHLFERDRRDLAESTDPEGRIDVLRLVRGWTSVASRTTLLARLELWLVAARDDELRELLDGHRRHFLEGAERTLGEKGVPDPADAALDLFASLNGELLRAATFVPPGEPYEPSEPFRRELSRYR